MALCWHQLCFIFVVLTHLTHLLTFSTSKRLIQSLHDCLYLLVWRESNWPMQTVGIRSLRIHSFRGWDAIRSSMQRCWQSFKRPIHQLPVDPFVTSSRSGRIMGMGPMNEHYLGCQNMPKYIQNHHVVYTFTCLWGLHIHLPAIFGFLKDTNARL